MKKSEKDKIIKAIKKKLITWDADPLAMASGGGVYNWGLRDAIIIIRRYL